MNKQKIGKIAAVAALSVCLMGLAFFGGYITRTYTNPYRSLEWVIELIGKNYVVYDEETGELKEFTAEDFTDAIVAQLLDQYSAYYTAEEYTDVVDSNLGNKYGVGLYFYTASEDPVIAQVAGNSPAERAGIVAGGQVTSLVYDGKTYELSLIHI